MLKVIDKAPEKKKLKFYTTEKLSDNRAFTPEGFLICFEAALSRTGTLIYKKDEVPVTPGDGDLITVIRYPEDVFKPEAIASFAGKSVVNNHPEAGIDVDVENWRGLEIGTILDPRRGTGDKENCLIADLLIKDKDAIELIKSGKVELSCGYEADYEEIKPGFAKQFGILGNHVALVDSGRCGTQCAIFDENSLKTPSGEENIKGSKMTNGINQALTSLRDTLNKTTIVKDESTMPDAKDILAVALEGLTKRLDKIESKLTLDRGRRDDDDRHRDDDRRRDSRRRDDDDRERDAYNYTMRYKGAHSKDDDDDDRHRDDDHRRRDDDHRRRDDDHRRRDDDDR